jgi:hypothetical protein
MDQDLSAQHGAVSVEQFVGPNSGYYLATFQAQEHENRRLGWNWPAFLFGPAWLAYRKMYQPAGFAACASYVASLIEVNVRNAAGSALGTALMLGMFLFVGAFGNYIYRLHAGQELGVVNRARGSDADRAALLAKKGGTSRLGAAFFAVLMVVAGLPALFM